MEAIREVYEVLVSQEQVFNNLINVVLLWVVFTSNKSEYEI